MAVDDAVRALRDHWDDVVARLGAPRMRELRDLIGKLDGAEHRRAVSALADLLAEELPPDHPVRRALSEGYMLTQSRPDWAELKVSLDALASVFPDPASADAAPAAGGSVLAGVVARLLRAPALAEDEVRRRGADPADPGLIRLDRPDGGRQWPEFQFKPGDGLLPVVRAVNDALDAANDPVGAADWWLSRNAWLDGQPSLLIGLVPDDHLVRAARALSAEV
jgi:hypothetical protein